GTAEMAMVRNAHVAGQPVQPGDVISIYATGLSAETHPVIRIAGTVAETLAVVPVENRMGGWEIQARVPASVSTSERVTLLLEVSQPDQSVVRSNEVTLAVESLD